MRMSRIATLLVLAMTLSGLAIAADEAKTAAQKD